MFAHVPLALIIQCLGWALGRRLGVPHRASLWLGCFAAGIACIVREITQHEYRWIEAFGHGRRANMPALEGLAFWDWNRHSIEETIVAIAASVLFALLVDRWVSRP
ncbi:MAG: hypothetical protein DI547_00190 [Sphingobium sp.]|nr:MAG: hypothetical protein DI547_00190 [Sphingobium sp.]